MNMRWLLLLLFSSLCLLMLACEEGSSTLSEGSSTPSPPSGEGSPLADLEIDLTVSDPAPQVGEPLEMTLTLRNAGSQPVQLLFSTSQRYDFLARNDAGEEVWRWSADMVFAQVLGEETLGPGGDLTFQETWDRQDNNGVQVAPARYDIEGSIVASVDCPPNAPCPSLTAHAPVHIGQE